MTRGPRRSYNSPYMTPKEHGTVAGENRGRSSPLGCPRATGRVLAPRASHSGGCCPRAWRTWPVAAVPTLVDPRRDACDPRARRSGARVGVRRTRRGGMVLPPRVARKAGGARGGSTWLDRRSSPGTGTRPRSGSASSSSPAPFAKSTAAWGAAAIARPDGSVRMPSNSSLTGSEAAPTRSCLP